MDYCGHGRSSGIYFLSACAGGRTWVVVITVIQGVVDGAIWLLDQGWRTRGRKSHPHVKPAPPLEVPDANGGEQPAPLAAASARSSWLE